MIGQQRKFLVIVEDRGAHTLIVVQEAHDPGQFFLDAGIQKHIRDVFADQDDTKQDFAPRGFFGVLVDEVVKILAAMLVRA